MSTDIKVITNEKLYQPCHIAMPDLWAHYCSVVGRLPHAADHWLVIDVINALQSKGCPTCGEKGNVHDAS